MAFAIHTTILVPFDLSSLWDTAIQGACHLDDLSLGRGCKCLTMWTNSEPCLSFPPTSLPLLTPRLLPPIHRNLFEIQLSAFKKSQTMLFP